MLDCSLREDSSSMKNETTNTFKLSVVAKTLPRRKKRPKEKSFETIFEKKNSNNFQKFEFFSENTNLVCGIKILHNSLYKAQYLISIKPFLSCFFAFWVSRAKDHGSRMATISSFLISFTLLTLILSYLHVLRMLSKYMREKRV